MKALSIRQPWADAVLYGNKRIENRTAWRNCHYRGALAVHAAKSMTPDEFREARDFMFERCVLGPWFDTVPLNSGAFVGLTEIIDVIRPGAYCERVDLPTVKVPDLQLRWWTGGFALVLGPVRVFKEPVPGRGMLGLFNVPDELASVPTW